MRAGGIDHRFQSGTATERSGERGARQRRLSRAGVTADAATLQAGGSNSCKWGEGSGQVQQRPSAQFAAAGPAAACGSCDKNGCGGENSRDGPVGFFSVVEKWNW